MKLTGWLNKMVAVSLLITSLMPRANAQTIGLAEAQQKSRSHYPLSQRSKLLEETSAISLANIAKGYLPQFSLNGQGTYQSDVTMVSIPLPGISIAPMSKDQYKLTADATQLLYDGGLIAQQQKISKLNTEVQQQQLEVELYQLKERVNQVYLSTLYIDEQLKQVGLVQTDLQTGIAKTQAQVVNGVTFRSNLDVLKAEQLKNQQRAIELQSTREGLIATLGILTGENLSPNTALEKPAQPATSTDIRRPELRLYSSQQKLVEQQGSLLSARNMPRLSLFGQGGYGRPGLNMLNNQFDWFYIAGVRLNWSLGGLYTLKNEKKQLAIDKSNISLQQQTFVLNTQTQLSQQSAEIKKQQALLVADDEIITLRERIVTASRAQLENGVATANDYLREVTAADQARQIRAAHQLLLLQAQINYQNINGN